MNRKSMHLSNEISQLLVIDVLGGVGFLETNILGRVFGLA